ncbi:PP2C family protein-serine/threonine phosphatase [Allochromatium vinosum]|uniref:Protein serine/threonine phosphatase n=1 Tax=Allochromatium vinosum (strain ATCC 17899 / DSM 180 / NBRC 103801 / NCIMB 10441 / D) TaxID=572477 RepID=D3RSJ0_ALLVD|nr:SpoIIE family protein phosphatase [Allochromatium vinosum]ADC62149.1 protein serine/threonine phosphatase [Allochromatium vinosum DSM 180]
MTQSTELAAGTTLSRIPLRHGLTFKQAAVTLLVVLLLGLSVGTLELILDWRAMRVEVRVNLENTLDLVEGSAAEALYQLNPELGSRVVDGLLVFDLVRYVELRDDFGRVLASRQNPPLGASAFHRWSGLFADMTDFSRPLRQVEPDGARTEVGVLRVELSPERLTERFLQQAARSAFFGVARAGGISLLVVILFYFMITRPLLRLARAVAEIDPTRPGYWPTPELPGHGHDELGLLLAHLRRLLGASQDGLDQRDRAQAELTALTRELEQRVQERTQALEQAMLDLETRKDEVERAFEELDWTHRRLSEANRLLLESHAYARRIQTTMLPDPAVLGDDAGELRVHWEPLHLVGGDWYWLERRGDQCLILLADCTGHGVPGAFVTLVLASVTEQVLRETPVWEPATILADIDRRVRRRLGQDRSSGWTGLDSDDGLDAAVLLWEVGSGTLEFAGVGSIPLLCLDPDKGIGTLRGTRGHLGYQSLKPPAAIATQRLVLAPGATLYLLTDGLTDQMGGSPRRLLGRRRLVEWLESHAALGLNDQIAGLCRMLADYRAEESRRDDMTLIAFRPIVRPPLGADGIK